jgi:hypothetical protein
MEKPEVYLNSHPTNYGCVGIVFSHLSKHLRTAFVEFVYYQVSKIKHVDFSNWVAAPNSGVIL